MNSECSVADLVRMFNEVLPSKSDQIFVFQQLIDSIAYCEELGSTAWSITLTTWGFRLNVGQVEVMTCEFCRAKTEETETPDDIWFIYLRIFLAGDDVLSKIKPESAVETIDEYNYSSVGARHWCYTGFFHAAKSNCSLCDPSRDGLETQLCILRNSRDKYLHLACHTSTGKLRQKSNFARSNCPALYDLARLITTAGADFINDRTPVVTQQQTTALGAQLGSYDKPADAGDIVSAANTSKLPTENSYPAARKGEVESGFIYLLVNPSMPGLVKIGRTARAIGTRVRELSMPTGVPTPFEVILDLFVSDSANAERLVHEHLASHRVATNREFFQVSTSMAIQAIYSAVAETTGKNSR